MLKISFYKGKRIEETIPDKEWEQVDTNTTSIASLLITIDNLEKGQSITIKKL